MTGSLRVRASDRHHRHHRHGAPCLPLLLAALLALVPFPARSVDYQQAGPLDRVVKAQVGDCKGGKPIRVPLITWGGDIATIHANGDARRTAAGSLFAAEKLDLELFREDVFARQVEAYLRCETPYLRGTLGMLNMAAGLTAKDPRTLMVPIYQMTWSAGGDALVVKPGIGSPRDLRGKTIALQSYGPHVDYLTTVLKDAGLGPGDVTLKWVEDLVGFEGNTPGAALQSDASVDAAFVILPDALALTSGGNVGSGAEDSVKGGRILLSTKTANRVIADLYVVRSDYLEANRAEVSRFVHGLLRGAESLKGHAKAKGGAFKKTLTASAEILLDSAQATADAEGLLGDAELVGYPGNVRFFGDPNYPRGIGKLNAEIQRAFGVLGLATAGARMGAANWDYAKLAQGLTETQGVEVPRFDTEAVAKVVTRRQQQGNLEEGELFAFEVFFQPNQNDFPASLYGEAFERVVELASTYGGAVITVEGHSDPLGYLRAKKEGKPDVVLRRTQQAAKNLSLARANAVRDSVVGFARSKSVTLDRSQFAVVGHGITRPGSGMCGKDPCAPKNEKEWRDNMRVEFRIIQVEAESSVFRPL
ncbi:MAG: ABC transporter substrate-binding protein [Myxococcota bacterium]|nr:ABC transporter substrate-binding protein [Myxococcota bacterium]